MTMLRRSHPALGLALVVVDARQRPLALDAEFRPLFVEGAISRDLTKWNVPCLIYADSEDEIHENAARAAAEIPGASFVSLPGHTHFSAELVSDQLLPRVLALFRSAAP